MNCQSIQAFEIVQILMSNGKEKGIDVNPVDLGGYTPADCAYECGNVELLQFFKDSTKSLNFHAKIKHNYNKNHQFWLSGSIDAFASALVFIKS